MLPVSILAVESHAVVLVCNQMPSDGCVSTSDLLLLLEKQ
jgi:hypothetical protein